MTLRPMAARILTLLVLIALEGAGGLRAQADSRFFPETGHTVAGLFLHYWDDHGGLAQQGYPLTEELREVSLLDSQTYTVQYFERAVLERHPEYAGTPAEVLLTQLGTYELRARYPDGSPTGTPNPGNPRLFPETGYSVGGAFRAYWEVHGGLAQQGYPLTPEFTETSSLDGHERLVQYFERAVFERHPENAGTPYEVLLAQLGTYQYDRRYRATPTAVPTAGGVPPTAVPVPLTAVPTPLPPPGADSCAGLPAPQQMEVVPPESCYPVGREYRTIFTGYGFGAENLVGVYITAPDGSVFGAQQQYTAGRDGRVRLTLRLLPNDPWGLYAVTMEDTVTHSQAIGHVKLTIPAVGTCPGLPPGQAAAVAPGCGVQGTTFYAEGSGFSPGEVVGVYVTYTDTGEVADLGNYQVRADAAGQAQARIVAGARLGRRAVSLEGVTSHHKAIGYYEVK